MSDFSLSYNSRVSMTLALHTHTDMHISKYVGCYQILSILFFTCQNRIACTGAILWSVLDCTHGWRLYLQFSIFTFGVYGSRVYAATLALSLVCAVTYPSIYVEKLKPYFLVSGIIIPSFLVGVQLLTVQVSKYRSTDRFLAQVFQ